MSEAIINEPDEWVNHMRSLLGAQVKVIIAYESPDSPEVSVYGELRSFNEFGEVALMDDTGVMSWSWPNLKTERVADGD